MGAALYQIVTFASTAFSGNPAFVLVAETMLDLGTLQRIAAQLREPVLAVITVLGGDLALRFVTPGGYHPGAGHSAHAAAYVALFRLRPEAEQLEFLLEGGRRMPVRRENGVPAVDWPIMAYGVVDAADRVRESLGVRPLETLSASFGLVAVLESAEQVAAIVPDLERIAALEENTLIVTAPDAGGDFAIRVFAPRLGLPEDPVCGTAHRIIVPMWAGRLGRTELVSRQLSPRGGVLYCRLGEDIVTLGGAAVPFLSGQLEAALG